MSTFQCPMSSMIRIVVFVALASCLFSVAWTENNAEYHQLSEFVFPDQLSAMRSKHDKVRNATRGTIDINLYQATFTPYNPKQRINAFARVFIYNSTGSVSFPARGVPVCTTTVIYNTTKPSWNQHCFNRHIHYSVHSQVVFEMWNYTDHYTQPTPLGGTWINVIDLINHGYNGKKIAIRSMTPNYPLSNVFTKIQYNGTSKTHLSIALTVVVLFIHQLFKYYIF